MGVRPADSVADPISFEDFQAAWPPPDGQEEPTETVELDEDQLLAHPAVIQALCTHGSLMCRYRIPDLFPENNQISRLFPSTSLEEEPCGLRSSISMTSLKPEEEGEDVERDE